MKYQTLSGLLALSLLFGCSSKDDIVPDIPPSDLYSEAQSSLQSGNWLTAIEKLEALDSRYPFGAYSEQVQLDLIYVYYKNDDLALGLATIERFRRLNPTHLLSLPDPLSCALGPTTNPLPPLPRPSTLSPGSCLVQSPCYFHPFKCSHHFSPYTFCWASARYSILMMIPWILSIQEALKVLLPPLLLVPHHLYPSSSFCPSFSPFLSLVSYFSFISFFHAPLSHLL